MKINMEQFRSAFFTEATEHLANMESGLLQLEHAPDDLDLLNSIFRGAHTIKGAAGTFGFPDVAHFTHDLENVLDQMREGSVQPNADLIEVLLRNVDTLGTLLECAKTGDAPPDCVSRVQQQLKGLLTLKPDDVPVKANISSAAGRSVRSYRVRFVPDRELFLQGSEPLLLLRELADLGEITETQVNTSALPPLAEMNPEICYLSWTLLLHTNVSQREIQDVFGFVSDTSLVEIVHVSQEISATVDDLDHKTTMSIANESDIATSTASIVATSGVDARLVVDEAERRNESERRVSSRRVNDRSVEQETVRVDCHRLDNLINVIGELVISGAMVEMEFAEWQKQSGHESQSLAHLSKTVRDLQELSLSLRMVPIAVTFQKMTRIVHDLARQLGKQIHFETEGEETELDKTVVDQIGDPLMHMVRNAADHGIETPDERIAAGKPAEGQITLRAFHQGGNIYIELKDDGRGLDRQVIRSKAIERQLIREEDNLSNQEIDNLIFVPGFSTAKQITDVSGRGVGMDVVRRNVEALQGSVSIQSEMGRGSTVTIRLPLTLAIMDGLSIGLSDDVYILPLLSVVESFRPEPQEIKRVATKGEVVVVRGEIVPLLRVYRLLNVAARVTEPSEGIVVIVENQGKKCALLVDELLGQSQVVIKNLETNFHKVAGIAGATILGDGRVAMILDIFGLMRLASNSYVDGSRPVEEKPTPTLKLTGASA
ncbi:MAG: chemotaxis protein CheA [Planctomycetia bacterium]|nr:chemotaxis protein CheA [Planctomycetia bacterium]